LDLKTGKIYLEEISQTGCIIPKNDKDKKRYKRFLNTFSKQKK